MAGCGGRAIKAESSSDGGVQGDASYPTSCESQPTNLSGQSRTLKCGTCYSLTAKITKEDDRDPSNISYDETQTMFQNSAPNMFGPLGVNTPAFGYFTAGSNKVADVPIALQDSNGYTVQFSDVKSEDIWISQYLYSQTTSDGQSYAFAGSKNLLPYYYDAATLTPKTLGRFLDGAVLEFGMTTAECDGTPRYCQIAAGIFGGGAVGAAKLNATIDPYNPSDSTPVVFDAKYKLISDPSGDILISGIGDGTVYANLGTSGGTWGDYKVVVGTDTSSINNIVLRNVYVLYSCLSE